MRHAYLIMAYGQYEQLNYLLRMLDDPLNVILVHIDKKSPKADENEIKKGVIYSEVYIYQQIKVYWGDFSQTQCEVFLLENALSFGCDYYHLLSGEDLPLTNQKKIHDFFEKNMGKEFVRFWAPQFPEGCFEWISHYHPVQKYLRISKIKWINVSFHYLDKLIQSFQTLIGINRICGKEEAFQKGATWFSITKELAQEIADKKEWIYNTFKSTRSSDEIFVQTILYQSDRLSERYEQQYEIDGLNGLRYIDWKRGSPYIFTADDFDELVNCGYLFARKFSFSKDKKIILNLFEYITQMNEN